MIEPNARFIALHCGDESKQLIARHPNAFLLLTQIAMRARFKDCPITGLRTGQAFIGDFREAGIQTQMAYRHAKQILTECGLATFQGTNKGTVATLENSMIFSISGEQRNEQGNNPATTQQRTRNEPTTNKQRTSNEQGTTNHNVHNDHNDHKDTKTQGHKDTIPFALTGDAPESARVRAKMGWTFEEGFSGITEKDRAEWQAAFPAVDIDRQLAAAHLWLKDNPKKRKREVGRFLSGWFSRKQERGGDIPSATPSKPAPVKTKAVPFEHYRKASFLEPVPEEGFIDPDIEDPIPF